MKVYYFIIHVRVIVVMGFQQVIRCLNRQKILAQMPGSPHLGGLAPSTPAVRKMCSDVLSFLLQYFSRVVGYKEWLFSCYRSFDDLLKALSEFEMFVIIV